MIGYIQYGIVYNIVSWKKYIPCINLQLYYNNKVFMVLRSSILNKYLMLLIHEIQLKQGMNYKMHGLFPNLKQKIILQIQAHYFQFQTFIVACPFMKRFLCRFLKAKDFSNKNRGMWFFSIIVIDFRVLKLWMRMAYKRFSLTYTSITSCISCLWTILCKAYLFILF